MLGKLLRNERRNTCRFGCCTRTRAHVKYSTKNQRPHDKRLWRKEMLI